MAILKKKTKFVDQYNVCMDLAKLGYNKGKHKLSIEGDKAK